MRVKKFTGVIAEDQKDVVVKTVYLFLNMLFTLFTNWLFMICIFLIMVFVGIGNILNWDSVLVSLIVLVLGGLGLWKVVPYLKKNKVANPFYPQNGATTNQILKSNKSYYKQFEMDKQEIAKSVEFTKIMVGYYLQANLYNVASKGKMFVDSANRQYELVDVPLTGLFYNYQNGKFNNESRILINSDIRFIEQLGNLEELINSALARIGLPNLMVKKIKEINSEIVINIEDVKEPNRFDFVNKLNGKTHFEAVKEIADSCSADEIKLSDNYVYNMTKQPHVLVAGGTGSGKSYFMNYMLWQLSLKGHLVYLADPKRSDLSSFDLYMPEDRVVHSSEDIINMFEEVYEKMEKRYEIMDEMRRENPVKYNNKSFVDFGFNAIVLIVDELSSFMSAIPSKKEADKVRNFQKQIMNKGRQAGVFFWSMMQQPNANNISTEVRNQFGLRLYLGQATNDEYRMVFDSAEIPNRKLTVGQGFGFQTGSGEDIEIVYTPFLDKEEIHQTNESAIGYQHEIIDEALKPS